MMRVENNAINGYVVVVKMQWNWNTKLHKYAYLLICKIK